jgi:rare lipoprotein A
MLNKQIKIAVRFTALFCLSFVPNQICRSVACAEQPASHQHTHYASPASSSESSVTAAKPGNVIVGRATWYGPGLAGHKTASGERFDPNKPTAAAKQMPLGSHAIVTNLHNGRSVKVRINDRGPVPRGCKIDLSKKAAQQIDMTRQGTAPVKIKIVDAPPR